MKIDLIMYDSESDGPDTFTLSNSGIDNDNFVEIIAGNLVFCAEVEELHAAVEAFLQLRKMRLSRESGCTH